MTEPFYRYEMTNNFWQEFQSVVQTMQWEELSDGELAEIEMEIQQIRELLDETSNMDATTWFMHQYVS